LVTLKLCGALGSMVRGEWWELAANAVCSQWRKLRLLCPARPD
jgi:hypothetical protein